MVEFSKCGECLEATFTGRISTEEVLQLWARVAKSECGLVIITGVTEIPTADDMLAASGDLAKPPTNKFAFVGSGVAAATFARMLSILCGLRECRSVFQRREQAQQWLDEPEAPRPSNER